MEIGLDSGSPDEVRQYLEWGLPLKKITTNPSTCAKTINGSEKYRSPFDIWEEMLSITSDVLISGETLGSPDYNPGNLYADLFADEAIAISELDKRMIVKLPAVPEALEAAKRLAHRIRVNYTLVFSLHQAMLAADYGGMFVSPFVGRYDDKLKKLGLSGKEGMDLARDIIGAYNVGKYPTYVLTASVRTKEHIDQAATAGSHYITIPFSLIDSLRNEKGIDWFREYLWSMQKNEKASFYDKPKATYGMQYDEGKIHFYEADLKNEGMKKFLDDAREAKYFVIPTTL